MRCIFACKINEKQVILASAKPIFEMQLYVRSGAKSRSYLANQIVSLIVVWQKPEATTILNDLVATSHIV
jgi:hypothetical protein